MNDDLGGGTSTALVSLDQLGQSVRVKLEKAEKYTAEAKEQGDIARTCREKARNMKISAGQDLVEARKYAPDFRAWLTEHNIGKSQAYQLIKIAGAADPEKEEERQRNAHAARVARDREGGVRHSENVPDTENLPETTTEEVEMAKLVVKRLSTADLERFKQWFREYTGSAPAARVEPPSKPNAPDPQRYRESLQVRLYNEVKDLNPRILAVVNDLWATNEEEREYLWRKVFPQFRPFSAGKQRHPPAEPSEEVERRHAVAV